MERKLYSAPEASVMCLEEEAPLATSNTFDEGCFSMNRETMTTGDGSDAAVKHRAATVEWENW